MGGKYKLLKEILLLLPENIHTFVDLFGGGFNVGVNVNAENIVYNDVDINVVKLLEYLSNSDYEVILKNTFEIIEQFNLSRTDLNGFEFYGCSSKTGRRIGIYTDIYYRKLREYYNSNKLPEILYMLSLFSFNYQIRFNYNGEFNMPCGKQDFNKAMQKRLKEYKTGIENKSIEFLNFSFDKVDFSSLGESDFVYCDPPYLNSIATYNEQNGWTKNHEKKLLSILDVLNEKGIKFALSNNLKYNNPFLDEWKNKYNIHYFNRDYSNCSYHKIDRSKDIEVLITNY